MAMPVGSAVRATATLMDLAVRATATLVDLAARETVTDSVAASLVAMAVGLAALVKVGAGTGVKALGSVAVRATALVAGRTE